MRLDGACVRSTLLVAGAVAGLALGALVGYGCSPQPARTEPLPSTAALRVPRLQPASEPPEPIREPPAHMVQHEERPLLPAVEPDLRVRIAALRDASAAPRFAHASGALLLTTHDGATRTVRTPVEIRVTAAGYTVREEALSAKGRVTQVAGRQPIELSTRAGSGAARGASAAADNVISFNGGEWPGPVRLVPLAESPAAVDIVVLVPLERYLPGVLARELYKNWSPETFRAQAIAARSFAVCEHAHWSCVRHYDLVAGEASQAWAGLVKDLRARQAVAETRGMVLVYQDRVVPAYYSSTCGGTPANAIDSLTRNPNFSIPPLLAGASDANAHRDCCRAAPRFRWEQTMPVQRVLAQLRRWAADQLQVQRTAIAEAAPPSQPTALLLAGNQEWRTDSAQPAGSLGGPVPIDGHSRPDESQPARLQYTPAGIVTADPDVAEDAPLDALSRVTGLQRLEVLAANQAGRPVRVRLVDARGAVLDMRAEDFRRAVNYAREGEATPVERLNSSAFSAQVSGAVVKFKGSGFGHGVGMCQFGAEAMAQKGSSAEQILRTYYPGSSTRRVY